MSNILSPAAQIPTGLDPHEDNDTFPRGIPVEKTVIRAIAEKSYPCEQMRSGVVKICGPNCPWRASSSTCLARA